MEKEKIFKVLDIFFGVLLASIIVFALSFAVWECSIKHDNKYGVKCSYEENSYTWTTQFQGTVIQTMPGKHEYFVRNIDSSMNLHMLLNLDSCGNYIEPMIMIFRNIKNGSIEGGLYKKIRSKKIVTYEPIMYKNSSQDTTY